MISDVLFDAIEEIDRYMADPVYGYTDASPATKRWIERVRNDMDALRAHLDNAEPVVVGEVS